MIVHIAVESWSLYKTSKISNDFDDINNSSISSISCEAVRAAIVAMTVAVATETPVVVLEVVSALEPILIYVVVDVVSSISSSSTSGGGSVEDLIVVAEVVLTMDR